MRHGQPATEVPAEAFLSDDPDLAMVNGDMGAWMDAHPCRADCDHEGPCACEDNCPCRLDGEQTCC